LSTDSNFRVDISKHGEPNAKKREQYKQDQKEEEERIREMKKSIDYKIWMDLRRSIDHLRGLKELYDDELAELNWRRYSLEEKMLKDYDIKIYTKYGLFRSHKYDGIY
jgi:N12 class adenine-specific DNA methylase